MLQASCSKYMLNFKEPGGTSRGILTRKETWFLRISDTENPGKYGIGECAVFRGLSADDRPGYEEKLQEVCKNINTLLPPASKEKRSTEITSGALQEWSSVRFGLETAIADLQNGGKRIPFPSVFSEGKADIEINGLIWMGDKETMQQRILEKLKAGFHCIKLKIGAIDFGAELSLLKTIRTKFGPEDIELRVDANGAFQPGEALKKLDQLSRFGIHSVEQPIRQGQWECMAGLCRNTPVPVALDEELIGVNDVCRKKEILASIKPQYIILKPALCGGFKGAEEWIGLAKEQQTGWWVTSALESNIGLNAIAQWAYTLHNPMPQGLGTGQLYTNNIISPLTLKGSALRYEPEQEWELSKLDFSHDGTLH